MQSQTWSSSYHADRRGFSIPEILVVVSVIAVLSGILLVGLSGVRQSGDMAVSMNNMRQIGTWMQLYSSDNRDTILPAQFDYSMNTVPGNVRTNSPPGSMLPLGSESEGTWADILWSIHNINTFPLSADQPDYRFDSPDQVLYDTPQWAEAMGFESRNEEFENPLRSSRANTKDTLQNGNTNPMATPWGDGAWESGQPGYFAANNFFDSRPSVGGNFYGVGQIKSPDRSVYLVDSFAGEIIEDCPEPWDSLNETIQVDFRYNDVCLMLYLDGAVRPEAEWEDLGNLERDRNIRIVELDQRSASDPLPACD